MSLQSVLINGRWQQAISPSGSFQAINPTTGEPLPAKFPISSFADLVQALAAAQDAVAEIALLPPEAVAHFLYRFSDEIDARGEALVETAYNETGLPKDPRLCSVELPRTVDQLRQAAKVTLDRSWRQATIDTNRNIRSLRGPLPGPVVVFGPNNFPFAFNSIAGGDFAAAIASGNPVIAKANPGHPGTTKIFAEAASKAMQASDIPLTTIQLIYHTESRNGLKLVSHPLIGATAFTGSRQAGLALKEAADRAGKPIYLEMSSINPVFILPGAVEERLAEISSALCQSCTLGAGQFCTKPGLIVLVDSSRSETLLDSAAKCMEATSAGTLLSERAPLEIARTIQLLEIHGAELIVGGRPNASAGFSFENTLLRVSGETFLKSPKELQTEVFGPVSLFVVAASVEQLMNIAHAIEGSLSASIYTDTEGSDDVLYNQLAMVLRRKVGRLLNDKMPTGVAVTAGMVHGGPYPATGHPGFTAVGFPASLERFTALYSYDNVPDYRLPPELKNRNPTKEMWRYIDGIWTQDDIKIERR